MSNSPTLNSYCVSCDDYFEFHKCNGCKSQYTLAATIDNSSFSLNVIWESDEDSDDEGSDEFYSDVDESEDESESYAICVVQKYSSTTTPFVSLATILESDEQDEDEDTYPHVDDLYECEDSVDTTQKPLHVSQQPTLDNILESDEEDDTSEVNSPHPSYEEEDDTPLYMGITFSTVPIAITVSVTVSISYSCS